MIILLDKGHGGMINGHYVTSPNKMYKHKDKSIAYEGVINRAVGNKILRMCELEQLSVIDICPTNLDLSLPTRRSIVNLHVGEYGGGNCLLISLHSNAGKGEGFEIWTSPGKTESDKYATRFYQMFNEAFPYTVMRHDYCDGDPDKENLFYMLTRTWCPAILPEWLFFDNYSDWVILRDEYYQHKYATMVFEFIKSVQ